MCQALADLVSTGLSAKQIEGMVKGARYNPDAGSLLTEWLDDTEARKRRGQPVSTFSEWKRERAKRAFLGDPWPDPEPVRPHLDLIDQYTKGIIHMSELNALGKLQEELKAAEAILDERKKESESAGDQANRALSASYSASNARDVAQTRVDRYKRAIEALTAKDDDEL